MDKAALKAAMLSLEEQELAHAREHYEEFLAEAQLDRTEPIERDEMAQSRMASDLAHAFDQPVHEHTEKIDKLMSLDFGPKTEVEEGAVVRVGGRYFVIAVSTRKFEHEGLTLMGISAQAPIYRAMEGKTEGDTFTLNGREMEIEELL